MNRSEIQAGVYNAIASVRGHNNLIRTEATRMKDGWPDIILALEHEFDIEIPDNDAARLISIHDIVDYIENKLRDAATDTAEKITKIVADHLRIDPREILPTVGLVDYLGATPDDMRAIAAIVAEKFAVTVPAVKTEEFITIEDVVEFVEYARKTA